MPLHRHVLTGTHPCPITRIVRPASAAAVLAMALAAASASAAITLETVPVGNVGNAPDAATGFGQVNYAYNIGKYEVTAGQYASFLNAVAGVDTYQLYNSAMANTAFGSGITQSGSGTSASPFTYSVADNFINRPVNYVSYWDACRFANWLQNGQPTGPQGAGTTETGVYTLTPDAIANNTVTRNANWQWAVTTQNEWYKAAYHKNDGLTANYFLYPTSSNTLPGRDLADASGNNANYYDGMGPYPIDSGQLFTTQVGQFKNSASPYGTFDQGGNVFEWNEAAEGLGRSIQGGSFISIDADMRAGVYGHGFDPTSEFSDIGFRVAQLVPAGPPAWVGGTSSDWGQAANWSPASAPDAATQAVTFGNAGSNAHVDLATANRTVGTLTFNSSVSTTIASSGGFSLILDNGTSPAPVAVAGTHTISAAVQANSDVTISGPGTLHLGAVTVAAAKTLTIDTGTTVTVDALTGPTGGLNAILKGTLKLNPTAAPRQTPAVAVEFASFDLASTGALDLTNHDLIVHYAPGDRASALAAATAALSSGQVTSSALTAGMSLGFVDNAALATPYTSFDGIALADANEILVKYTYTGDANLDGKVTFADFQLLLSGYGNASTWATGDFNGTGNTSFADFQLLLSNYGAGTSSPTAPAVPEPASLSLLALGALGLLTRKRT